MPDDASSSPAVRRRRARRRAEILEAAWTLAREQGIGLLSLRGLAKAVGMRAPSLYEYFADKDAIYDAMFAQGWEALDQDLQALPRGGDREAELIGGVRSFLDFCAADQARYQLMFTRVIPGWEPSPAAYKASVASFDRFVQIMAEAGIDQPADIDLWTAITSGLAAQQAANEPGGHRYRRLAPAAVQMFLDHLDNRKDQP